MPTQQSDIRERLGSAIQALATLEERASSTLDDKTVQRLVQQCRRLMADLERGFSLLQEATAEQLALRRQADAAARRAETLFNLSPVACVVVHESGEIAKANGAATRLLNLSTRNLVEMSFDLFVGTDRSGFLAWLRSVAQGTTSESRVALVRPRERRPKQVTVVAAPDLPGRVALVLMDSEPVVEEPKGAGAGISGELAC
jgi:PAS domain-containing protein